MSEQSNTFDINNSGTSTVVTELVGEGKKFKTVEDLAKGKMESDEFIEKLKTENKALREALSEESNPDEMLRKINEALSSKTRSNTDATPPTSNQPQKESLSKQEVLELLSAREQQEKIKQNTQMFNEQVNKSFGEKAEEFVTNRLNDLGMDRETLNDLATRNPKAALRVLGLKESTSTSGGTMDSSINTEAYFGPAGKGNGEVQNFAYFQKLRRELKEGYYVPEIQRQVFEARKKLGDAFWK